MWPLCALAFIGLVLFVERTLFLHKGRIRAADFLEGIENLVRKDRLLEAITLCQETQAPVAQVIKAALLCHDKGELELRYAVQNEALAHFPSLERRIGSIAAIAKVAPLIGLIGTVLALLDGFIKMQTLGPYANVAAFSGNVVQALVTTVTGLIIAVFAYLGCHFLQGRVRALVHDLEWVGNSVIVFLSQEMILEDSESLYSKDDASKGSGSL